MRINRRIRWLPIVGAVLLAASGGAWAGASAAAGPTKSRAVQAAATVTVNGTDALSRVLSL